MQLANDDYYLSATFCFITQIWSGELKAWDPSVHIQHVLQARSLNELKATFDLACAWELEKAFST